MKKMNKRMAAALLATVSATAAVGMTPRIKANEISVELDGNAIEFDVAPQIVGGRTMVPLRKIFEEIGALVKWDGDTRTVSARKSAKTVSLTIDNEVLTVDKGDTDSEGNPVTESVMLDAAAQIIDGRTMVPARAISEAFGLDVVWDEENSKVIITSKSDEDDSWKENVGSIDLSTLTYSGDGVEIDKNEIKITRGGDYTVSGTLADGSITISSEEKVKLRLSGAEITAADGPCIFVENADKAYITLTQDTKNKLYAKNSEKGAIYSKDKLEIKGGGQLEVISDAGHAIKVCDNLTIENGSISLDASKDGIHVDNTFKMTGGKLDIEAVGDGIDSESIVMITDGELSIKTCGVPIENETEQENEHRFGPEESIDVEFENSSKGINAEWMLSVSGGKIEINAASHAIHCGDEIEITGGEFTISSEYEKGISAHGNFTVSGGKIYISKSTEGLESKNVMTINDGIINITASDDAINATGGKSGEMFGGPGGMPPMDFNHGGESNFEFKPDENFPDFGFKPEETEKADWNGNNHEQAFGDGAENRDMPRREERDMPRREDMPQNGGEMPPMGGSENEKDCLIINGGELTLSSGDDCLDSNGNLVINGGYIRAVKENGTFTGANAVIDPDGTTKIGGDAELILAAGNGGERSLELAQNTVTIYCESEQSEKITVKDSTGKEIYEYSPAGAYRCVMISSKKLETGKTYTICAGSESFEVEIAEQNTTVGEAVQNRGPGGGKGNRQPFDNR